MCMICVRGVYGACMWCGVSVWSVGGIMCVWCVCGCMQCGVGGYGVYMFVCVGMVCVCVVCVYDMC